MAIFGFGKGKEDPAAVELVLAYLEDALRCRSPFTVANGEGKETSALAHSVHEDSRSFRLLPKDDLPFAKGARAAFTLIHEGLRIGGAGRVLEARTGVLALELPDSLSLMERRARPRVRLNPKEMATLTALQELFAGVGITSGIENLSEGGARVRVEKALAIGTEKRLVLGTNLVAPGQRFMVVKLNQVPRCPPVLETEGKAVYLAYEAGGLVMGLAFTQVPGPVAGALRNLAAQRGSPSPAALPAKARRRTEPREPEPPAASDPAAGVSTVPDRRHAPRLSLGRGHRARFMVGDLLLDQAELTDISAGGCCLRLAPEQCQGIQKGIALDEFHLLHDDLPKGVLPCRVKWVLGRIAGDAGPGQRYCLVGVEFLLAPEALTRAIEAFVTGNLP